MKSWKIWLAIGVSLLIIMAVLFLRSSQPVEAVKVETGTVTLTVEEPGYVQAVNEYDVQSDQPARINEIMIETGDRVKAGQILMRLSNPELTTQNSTAAIQLEQAISQLEQARLMQKSLQEDLKQAQNDLSRTKTLLDNGAATPVENEQMQLQVSKIENSLTQQEVVIKSAEQQVAELREISGTLQEKTAELQVLSPISGTVLDLPVKKGQVVAPGTQLAMIGSETGLEVKTELLSDETGKVKIGQPAHITAPVLGDKIINGTVTKINPRAYEKVSALGVVQSRVPVIITIDKTADLHPGYEVRVSIEVLRKENVLVVPRESVRLNSAGYYQVMSIVDGQIKIQDIETGEKNGQLVEIKAGLKEGQILVRDASQDLKEGTRVKPIIK
ncbi:MAG: efflux RND transporter periplasmic adaptor subunit [Syntrophomonadaceae bacterium]|nr:efflux RND transporter periplasmic adaptor subunit [Syntrophomonadaceae bacterium]